MHLPFAHAQRGTVARVDHEQRAPFRAIKGKRMKGAKAYKARELGVHRSTVTRQVQRGVLDIAPTENTLRAQKQLDEAKRIAGNNESARDR